MLSLPGPRHLQFRTEQAGAKGSEGRIARTDGASQDRCVLDIWSLLWSLFEWNPCK